MMDRRDALRAIDAIQRQIGESEDERIERGGPHADLRWLRSAQGALRWKKRVLLAISQHRRAMRPPNAKARRYGAILAVVHDELGEAEFMRLKQIAAARNPGLFGQGGGEV